MRSIRQGRGRKRLYSAAEPLYSMYYKLRREQDEAAVVENLIRFHGGVLWGRGSVEVLGVADQSGGRVGGLSTWNPAGPREPTAPRRLSCRQEVGLPSNGLSEHARTRAEARAIQNLEEPVRAAAEAEEFERVIELVEEDLSSRLQEPPTDSYTAWDKVPEGFRPMNSWGMRAWYWRSPTKRWGFADSRDEMVQLWTAPDAGHEGRSTAPAWRLCCRHWGL